MGFLRKAIVISTGGLAPIKWQSYAERTAKATEAQLRLQRQALAPRPPSPVVFEVHCPYCNRRLVLYKGTSRCTNCHGGIKVSRDGSLKRVP